MSGGTEEGRGSYVGGGELVECLSVRSTSAWAEEESSSVGIGVMEDTHLLDVEQFCDDGGYPPEERWASLSLHLMAVALDLDKSAFLLRHVLRDARRIHVVDERRGTRPRA